VKRVTRIVRYVLAGLFGLPVVAWLFALWLAWLFELDMRQAGAVAAVMLVACGFGILMWTDGP